MLCYLRTLMDKYKSSPLEANVVSKLANIPYATYSVHANMCIEKEKSSVFSFSVSWLWLQLQSYEYSCHFCATLKINLFSPSLQIPSSPPIMVDCMSWLLWFSEGCDECNAIFAIPDHALLYIVYIFTSIMAACDKTGLISPVCYYYPKCAEVCNLNQSSWLRIISSRSCVRNMVLKITTQPCDTNLGLRSDGVAW